MHAFRAKPNAMSKVSVIMPNYNHAPFLKERMDSILAQDYPDFEVIILDDASTDESAAILQSYATHPKVKKIITNETNSGNTFVQWQKGLEEATGEYVWIAESDDVASKDLLSRLVGAMERECAVMAFCKSTRIDSEGHPIKESRNPRWNRDFTMEGETFVRNFLLGYNAICNASAVVFNREAAKKINMQQVEKFTASGDRLFWIELALQGRVSYVSEALNRFRQHTHKVSGSAEQKGLNIVQDYEIYNQVSALLPLSGREKQLICGYHWKAIHQATVSEEGRKDAMREWKKEPLFGRWAYMIYSMHRVIEKC